MGILNNVYSRVVFPRLCDFFLDRPAIARLRTDLLTASSGHVLEIGFGTGLDLPHYPPHVGKITGVDPNDGMRRRAEKRSRETGIEVEWRVAAAERLPFEDGTFDCVVSTWTLCSVGADAQALAEVHRVLKPGGRFLFLEHGLSTDQRVVRWQHRLDRVLQFVADGCRLTKNVRAMVSAQPFASVELDEFYLANVPKTHGYVYRGTATK